MRPMLSVCCATYNHEKYLRQALDGILMQKVNFPMEVIVGEDGSKDGSKMILQEYERLYPGFFHVIYHDKNVGASRNFDSIYERAAGKYVITLETDDFWTDPQKLQRQVDYLEEHEDVAAVTHRCIIVDENSNPLEREYPSIREGFFKPEHMRRGLMPGQTASMMYRNFHYEEILDTGLYRKDIKGPGDQRKVFSLLTLGKIYCMPEVMSAYRFVTSGGSSFSANHKPDYENSCVYYRAFAEYAHAGNYDASLIRTGDTLYLKAVVSAFIHKKKSMKDIMKALKYCRYPLGNIADVIKHYCNRR